jgi:hypothetical protein
MARRLRIGASLFFAVLAVLVCILWVRSYWWLDTVILYRGGNWYGNESAWGVFRTHIMFDVGVGDGLFRRSDPLSEARFPKLVFTWFGRIGGPVFTTSCSLWIPAMLFASIAAAPWFRWRYSLRTLLLTTTLVAIVLGLAVWLAA